MEFFRQQISFGLHFFNNHLPETLFIYALSFIILGIAILVQPRKGTQYKLNNILWLLIAFAFIHAPADFFDMRAAALGKNETLFYISQILTFIAYGFLFEFGRRLLKPANISINWWLLPILETVIIVGALFSSDFWITVNVLEGYIIRFPAGFMAGLGLWLYYQNNVNRYWPANIKKYFIAGTAAFWGWTIFCGLIRAKANFFPANWLNVENFSQTVGMPVYLFRTIFVLILAWAIIHILRILDFETQQKLIAEKTKLENTLDSIGDGAFVIDINGQLTFFNKIAEQITEVSKENALGKPYFEVLKFVHENDRSPNYKFIEKALTQNKITHIENHTILISKNGKEIPVADSSSPIHDPVGKVIGCIVIFRDITREYELDKMKSEFIAIASHQLRTPLSAIKWSLETELDGSIGRLNADQIVFLQNAYEAAERMTSIVNGLLNISRIETDQLAVKPQATDIALLCNKIITELQPCFSKKEQKIQFQKNDNSLIVSTDPKLLHEIIINLLSNAINYTPKHSIITLTLKVEGPYAVISITDTGIGIPNSQQNKIFGKFFRADNASKKSTEGTGLGLYVVKRLVELLEGKIRFESKEGKGTTFFVSIPLKGINEKHGNKELA